MNDVAPLAVYFVAALAIARWWVRATWLPASVLWCLDLQDRVDAWLDLQEARRGELR